MTSSVLVAIDPGHAGRGNAVAQFNDGVLRWVWFERAGQRPVPVSRVDGYFGAAYDVDPDTVVIEKPEYQGDRTQQSRPADLINLAWSGAMLAGTYVCRGARLVELTPREWKGSTPKPVCHNRLWARLSDDEHAVLGGDETYARIREACQAGALNRWGRAGVSYYPRTWDMHNILDSAALGVFALGRAA